MSKYMPTKDGVKSYIPSKSTLKARATTLSAWELPKQGKSTARCDMRGCQRLGDGDGCAYFVPGPMLT